MLTSLLGVNVDGNAIEGSMESSAEAHETSRCELRLGQIWLQGLSPHDLVGVRRIHQVSPDQRQGMHLAMAQHCYGQPTSERSMN